MWPAPRGLTALAAVAALAAAVPARAVDLVRETRGHVAVGYGRLLVDEAPGGSASFGAGVELPLRADLAVGVNVDYHLLGSSTVRRGVLEAQVDYSLFNAAAALHWRPGRSGPLKTLTLLAGAYAAHADLNSAPGGTAFLDVPRDEVAPGGGLALTFFPWRESLLRLGFELAGHVAFLQDDTWTLLSARAAVHY